MKFFKRWIPCILVIALLFHSYTANAEQQTIYGDANGDGQVSSVDALILLLVVVDKIQITQDDLALAADVSGDYYMEYNYIHDAYDALLILKYVVGRIDCFPAVSLNPLAPADPPSFEADGILTPGNEVDFVIDIPHNEDIKILQLSDLQSTRLDKDEVCRNSKYKSPYRTDSQTILWQYVDEAVMTAQPDVIVLVGDIIQGIFDDDGRDWLEFCNRMDGYKIPWLVVMGNHDRESLMGVQYLVDCINNSSYGLFSSQNVSGTSNYSVVLRQNNVYRYVLWMIDTHGSDGSWIENSPDKEKIITTKGVRGDQLRWIKNTYAAISYDLDAALPSLAFMHIAPANVASLVKKKYPNDYKQFPFTPFLEGDFGIATESIGGVGSPYVLDIVKEIGCSGLFFGHQHQIAFSMMLQDIRMTWGLKTGKYSYCDEELNGSTLITISKGSDQFNVEYLYTQLD